MAKQKKFQAMAIPPELTDALERISTGLTEMVPVAKATKALIAQLRNDLKAGMTPAEVAALQSKVTELEAKNSELVAALNDMATEDVIVPPEE